MKKIICLTPVKNEAWILDSFIKSANLWADQIIIAYQKSDDETNSILKANSKLIKVIENNSGEFNEPERQKMLIEEARKIKGNNIFIALDADEFLTLDDKCLLEFKKIKKLKPGTVIMFDWLNVKLDDGVYWKAIQKMPLGYVDKGDVHSGQTIHSIRVPMSNNSKVYNAKNIKVMHYQYADWERMESKHRWYQCWEHINNQTKSAVDIYRQYHHMYSIKKKQLRIISDNWYQKYNESGIDLKNVIIDKKYYWDCQVLDMFKKKGRRYFRKLSIWNVDWNKLSESNKFEMDDPRSFVDKIIQKYLKLTQINNDNSVVKKIDSIIRLFY